MQGYNIIMLPGQSQHKDLHFERKKSKYWSKSFQSSLSKNRGAIRHSKPECMPHSSRIQIMPARQPAIQLRSNRPLFTPPFQLPSHLPCKPLMLSPPSSQCKCTQEEKQTICSRDRQLKCKSCSSGLRRTMRNREQEANRMHPFDARASGYVRSVMCVFENRAKFERVCVEGVSSSVTWR